MSKSSNNPLNVFLCNCMKSSDGLHDDKKEGDPLLLAGLGGYMHLPSENKFEYIVILYLRNITSPPRTGHYSKLQVLCICQKQNSSSAHYLHGEELDFLVIDCDSGNF